MLDACEVVVVDNSSDDDQFGDFVQKYPGIRFIQSQHNVGFGAGCRLGARHALSDYFLFLNPDTVANRESIYSMLEFLKAQETYGIVSCRQHENLAKHRLLFPNIWRLSGLVKSLEARLSSDRFKIKHWQDLEFLQPDWVSASVLMISRKNYEKIGGWSQKLWMYYEDPDLCRRFKNLGGLAALITNRKILHKHGGSTRLDLETTALTKTELATSRHVYIQEHFQEPARSISQVILIIGFLLFGGLSALMGIVFFFIPIMRLQSVIWRRKLQYYVNALKTGSWLSPRLLTREDDY